MGSNDSGMSELEQLRQQNIEERNKLLAELDFKSDIDALNRTSSNIGRPSSLKKRSCSAAKNVASSRKSLRLENRPVGFRGRLHEDDDDDWLPAKKTCSKRKSADRIDGLQRSNNLHKLSEDSSVKQILYIQPGRKNVFGAIPGVPVGTTWEMRWNCSLAEIHRPLVSGIHGGADGCYSICLSGGYEDDIDDGETFTFTGQGGRDLKGTKSNPKNLRTAPQSKDQELLRNNLYLTYNIDSRVPVRVVRGFKSKSIYAPEEGYRYDGLYTVERYWVDKGESGFKVYRYACKRVEDQGLAPWEAGFVKPPKWKPPQATPMVTVNDYDPYDDTEIEIPKVGSTDSINYEGLAENCGCREFSVVLEKLDTNALDFPAAVVESKPIVTRLRRSAKENVGATDVVVKSRRLASNVSKGIQPRKSRGEK